MKSKFARCAKERQDRENEIRFDAKSVGDVFSQNAANMAASGKPCHKIPQMHDMRNAADNARGAEKYVTHARRPFMNSAIGKKRVEEGGMMLFALGVMYAADAPAYNYH